MTDADMEGLMTDEQILAMFNNGKSRKDIADYAGKTVAQVKHALDRARRDPLTAKIMSLNGTEMVPVDAWIKEDWGSVRYAPKANDANSDDNLITRLQDAFADIPAYEPVASAHDYSDLMTVYPLYDLHAGMLAYGRETRGPDFDLELFQSDLIASVTRLADRAPNSSHALVIIGGDAIHINDSTNQTPGHKHNLDADGRFEKVIDVAVNAISHVIEHLATKHPLVSVVVLKGNHDIESHLFLKVALKQRYRNSDRIKFPVVHGADKSEIFWIRHGNALIAAHHGDKAKPEKLAMIVADQCGFWSETKHRIILTGHVHHLRTLDLIGVTHYTMRAFSPPDAYGANFGGVRGLQAMTICPKHGLIGQLHDSVWREE